MGLFLPPGHLRGLMDWRSRGCSSNRDKRAEPCIFSTVMLGRESLCSFCEGSSRGAYRTKSIMNLALNNQDRTLQITE